MGQKCLAAEFCLFEPVVVGISFLYWSHRNRAERYEVLSNRGKSSGSLLESDITTEGKQEETDRQEGKNQMLF